MISRLNILKIIVVIAVLISFGFLIRATDMQKVLISIQQVGFRFVFLLMLTFIAYCFAAIGWKYCIGKPGENLKITDLFFIRHIGEMVSIVNPASVIGGEAVKIYMLQKKGIDKTNIIASVLISRVLMAATQVLLFFVSLVFIFLSGKKTFPIIPQHIAITPVIALAFLIMLIIFAAQSDYIKQTIQRTKVYIFFKTLLLEWKLKQVLTEFRWFFKTNLKGLLYSCFFFSLHWVIGSLEIYFILLFLGIKTSVTAILLVDMGIVLFKSAGVFVPGQIGVEEMGNKFMLEFVGIPNADIWITVSILRRSRQLFWIAFGLAAYLIFYNRKSEQPETA